MGMHLGRPLIKFHYAPLMLAIWLALVHQSAVAQSGCLGQLFHTNGAIDGIRNVIQMAGDFPEQTGLTAPKGDFHKQSASLIFYHGQRVLLSGSPDGRGALCSDDAVELYVQQSGKTWRHEFPNAARTRIEPIGPVDVTNLFQAGENTVTLTLIDLMPPAFSSSSYYLLVVGSPQQKPTQIPPTATRLPANTPTELPTIPSSPTATILPSSTATWTPQPPTATPLPTVADTSTQVPTISPTQELTAQPSLVTMSTPVGPILVNPTAVGIAHFDASTNHSVSNTPNNFPFWSLAILGLTGVAGLGFAVYAFGGEGLRLEGLLFIKDGEGNLINTVDLSARGRETTFGSQGLDALSGEGLLPVAVKVRARRAEDVVEILWQILDESGQVVTEHPLHHGNIEQVGQFTFEYQNFAQETVDDLMFEGEIWDEN